MNKEEIIKQINEWILYNKDQQKLKNSPYFRGYYEGKISALVEVKLLLGELD